MQVRRFVSLCLLVGALFCSELTTLAQSSSELPVVQPNDNRSAAGVSGDNLLTLKIRAAEGTWRPEGDSGPSLRIEAFGEEGRALQIPAPLIRVREGTSVVATIRNDLGFPLSVNGLCARNGEKCAPVDVPPGERRDVRFALDRAGTYHYWGTTSGMPMSFRGTSDTQLSGALVVDPAQGEPEPDRIFVLTEWTDLTRDQLKTIAAAPDPGVEFIRFAPKLAFLVNGLSWPATERLTYRLGESVKWRVINLGTQRHPMHMHGFYYDVDSIGDGLRDTTFAADRRQRVVTQLMPPGGTLSLTWKPERAGNWLFHCHVMHHVSPDRRLSEAPASHGDHAQHDPGMGMAGLVMGVTVVGTEEPTPPPAFAAAPRRLTLTMRPDPKAGGKPAYGFALTEGSERATGSTVSIPGPTLVLRRGEPVEIALVNELPESTAVHWHGMELDSYYDGVHGWSGAGARVTPIIQPGATFVVRFTPPRTGTFIYHTHLHDHRQLPAGLYGALIVVDPAASTTSFDPATDHVFVIGGGGFVLGSDDADPPLLNGESSPSFVWKAGTRHRVRLINITTDDIYAVTLQTNDGPVTWRPLTKDGAPLPPDRCAPGLARQVIAVGETYDFEYEAPPGRQNLWLEVRTTGGKWQVQGLVMLR